MLRFLTKLVGLLKVQEEPQPRSLSLFLSYSRSEEKVAHELKAALEDQGHECWAYLLDSLEPADDVALSNALFERIMANDAVIVVASNASMKRRWVNEEIEMATTRLRRVLLVLVETYGTLAIPAETADHPKAHWVKYDSRDPKEGARRVIRKLRDNRPWGTSQTLPPLETEFSKKRLEYQKR